MMFASLILAEIVFLTFYDMIECFRKYDNVELNFGAFALLIEVGL